MKKSKYDRILSLYSILSIGGALKKKDIALKFGVTERTIQRDIDDIRFFYLDNTLDIGCGKKIIYDRKLKAYKLIDSNKELFTNAEMLAVCKILLESRSLIKSEMVPIIEKLLNNYIPLKDKKIITELIANEMFHYVEPRHGKGIVDNLWDIGLAIRENRYIELTYTRSNDKKVVVRKIKPVGIMVSEFYFYLVAFIVNIDKKEHFQNPNDLFPTIYRIDRINKILLTEERFDIPYKDRFEEGEFRKRVQFMYGGKLQTVKFKYSGYDIDAILDRLPTAQILSKDENGVYNVSAEVFGSGIDMWLKSQDKYVNVME